MGFLPERPCVVVFDLDDTLYKELDFVESAFDVIAVFLTSRGHAITQTEIIKLFNQDRHSVFQTLVEQCDDDAISLDALLELYRFHEPTITLPQDSRLTLEYLHASGYPLGLVTDGRSLTQRAKIRVLGIEHYFSQIVISEEVGTTKPHLRNFLIFQSLYPAHNFVYVGNDVNKDFIAPNQLGWTTICLQDDGRNIHTQELETLPEAQQPHHLVTSLPNLWEAR